MDNNQNPIQNNNQVPNTTPVEHPAYERQEYNNATITVNEQQNVYQQAVTDYTDVDKKTAKKKTIRNVILCIIAAVNYFVLSTYVSNLIERILNGQAQKTIDMVVSIYLIISIIFLIACVWCLVKKVRILKVLFIIAVIAFLGMMGYRFYRNYKPINDYKNTVSKSLILRAKEICKFAQDQWKSNVINNGASRKTYYGSNGKNCNQEMYYYTGSEISYSVTIDEMGNVVEFKITDGKFQLNNTDNGFLCANVKSDMFEKVTESNKIVIPTCN